MLDNEKEEIINAQANKIRLLEQALLDRAAEIERMKQERDAAIEDLKNCMHFSEPKNNNVCSFCKKDMAEYPEKCKGWDDNCFCSPEWRGIKGVQNEGYI